MLSKTLEDVMDDLGHDYAKVRQTGFGHTIASGATFRNAQRQTLTTEEPQRQVCRSRRWRRRSPLFKLAVALVVKTGAALSRGGQANPDLEGGCSAPWLSRLVGRRLPEIRWDMSVATCRAGNDRKEHDLLASKHRPIQTP